MKNIKFLNLVILIIFYLHPLSAQQNFISGNDTICFNDYQLIIRLPSHSLKKVTNYEEGFFIDYSTVDTSVITIHCGYLVSKPLISEKKSVIIDDFCVDKDIRIIKGYYIKTDSSFSNKSICYFREEDFPIHGITIMYEYVDRSKLDIYDTIFDNIKILKQKIRGK